MAYAAHIGDIAMMDQLLSMGSDISAKNNVLCYWSFIVSCRATFAIILLTNIDNLYHLLCVQEGRDAFFLATLLGNVEVLDYLLSRGASVNTTDNVRIYDFLYVFSYVT